MAAKKSSTTRKTNTAKKTKTGGHYNPPKGAITYKPWLRKGVPNDGGDY